MDFILKSEKISNEIEIPVDLLNKYNELNKNKEKTNWKYKRFKPKVKFN
jgi:hypothetical protein